MEYKQIFENNKAIFKNLYLCVHAIQKQNFDRGIRLFQEMLPIIQSTFEQLLTHQAEAQEAGISLDTQVMMQILSELMKAQEEKDFILLGDMLELMLEPFCTELQLSIQQIAGRDTTQKLTKELYPNYWNKNIEKLKTINVELAGLLENSLGKLKKTEGAVYAYTTKENVQYYIEETQKGYLTLRICRNACNYYMHSNKDAATQAEIFAEAYMDINCEEYDVLGIGLGYHIQAIAEHSLGIKKIHAYEPDINVLIMALIAYDFTTLLQDTVCIHYDPNLTALSREIVRRPQGFIIHYPSIANIGNEAIRSSFKKYFVKDSTLRNHFERLYMNFQYNVRKLEEEKESCQLSVIDEVLEDMQGKTVCIIAAGPSLDKNVALLQDKKEKLFLLATGTVYFKLMKMGIRPDAVIITDSNDRVLGQIRENEKEDIPIYLLSTANYQFINRYKGKKYLIFQQDFEPAERKAKEYGCHLFQTGGSVSTTALDIAIRAHAEKIIFMGLDLAFTDNLAHASGTSSQIATNTEELIPVKSFYGGSVLADQKFIIYREWIEQRIKEADAQKIQIINATEGGCHVEGVRHMTFLEAIAK